MTLTKQPPANPGRFIHHPHLHPIHCSPWADGCNALGGFHALTAAMGAALIDRLPNYTGVRFSLG